MDSLDAIVTAVSEVILVFEEAQTNLAASIVMGKSNWEQLLNEINKLLDLQRSQSELITNPDLKSQMQQTIIDISNCTARLGGLIVTHSELQTDNRNGGQPYYVVPRTLYEEFHVELKNIIQAMVKQLQITDRCNVDIIMHSARVNLQCIARMKGVDTLSGLVAVARESSKFGLDFQMYLKQRLAETTDASLRTRLMDAAEVVRTSQPIAVECCKNFIENPNSENQAKKERALKVVITALQEIVAVIAASAKYINDFSLMFDLPPASAFDLDGEPRVEEALSRLEHSLKKNDVAGVDSACQELDREVLKQIAQAKEIASKIASRDPAKAQRILQDCDDLQKVTAKITSLAPKSVRNPADTVLRKQVNDLIDEARKINQRINDSKKAEKELLENARRLMAALDKLLNAAKNADSEKAIAAAREMSENIKRQLELGRNAANDITNPARRQAVLEACEELERLAPELIKALKKVLADPNDKQALKELQDIIERAKLASQKMNRAILEDQLEKNKESLQSLLSKLNDQVSNGDSSGAADTLRDLNTAIQRRIELGRNLANEVTDPDLRSQIVEACDLLEKKFPELVIAARDAAQNPNDAAAMGIFKQALKDVEDAADRITSEKKFELIKSPLSTSKKHLTGSFLQMGPKKLSPDLTAEEIISNSGKMERAMEKLLNAVRKGDPMEAARAAKELIDQMKRQVELGRNLAESCPDPVLKKKILDACDTLESLMAPIAEATKDAVMNPGDKAKQERLENLLTQAKAANQVIVDAAEQLRSPERKLSDITASMKSKMNMGENNNAAFNKDGKKDAIMVAADAVTAASKVAPVSAEHKSLLDIAAAIAREMELLSQAAKNKNKKDMIETAKRIAGMIGQIQTFSSVIINKCTDSTLKDNLNNLCRVPKNFSVQLKIIAAVKATSGDNDASAEHQLVTCAQGLANSVIQTVKAAEAASLKCPKGTSV